MQCVEGDPHCAGSRWTDVRSFPPVAEETAGQRAGAGRRGGGRRGAKAL